MPVYVGGTMIKKRDCLICVCVMSVALIIFLVMKLPGSAAGNQVLVRVDGELYGTYSLNDDQEILIQTKNGQNCLCISGGEVYMKASDCPDGYCKRQGHILNVSETIVCLPHKLVVEIGMSESMLSVEQDNDSGTVIPDVTAK